MFSGGNKNFIQNKREKNIQILQWPKNKEIRNNKRCENICVLSRMKILICLQSHNNNNIYNNHINNSNYTNNNNYDGLNESFARDEALSFFLYIFILPPNI